MPKLPMKFEALSKVLYVAYIGIGGAMLMVFAMAWVADHAGYGLSATLGLASGIGLWLALGLGFDGLERYWKLRHDAEMLEEVDRLQDISVGMHRDEVLKDVTVVFGHEAPPERRDWNAAAARHAERQEAHRLWLD